MLEETLEITNELEELHKVNAMLEQLEESWKIPAPIVMNVSLCMEEALTNVIFYAYADSGKHKISIKIQRNQSQLCVTIEDKGRPFNPLEETKAPDVKAKIEEREIGGLGVFFIKQFMDKVDYQRVENTNRLKMIKQL